MALKAVKRLLQFFKFTKGFDSHLQFPQYIGVNFPVTNIETSFGKFY